MQLRKSFVVRIFLILLVMLLLLITALLIFIYSRFASIEDMEVM